MYEGNSPILILIAPYIFAPCMNAMKKEILRISHIKEF